MKIAAYCPLHYGKEYLRWSIESIYDFVDKIIILYTGSPSYGHGTRLVCSDSHDELRSICNRPKIEWHEGCWGGEGHHRDSVMRYVGGYDILLPLDADEVWEPSALERCVRSVATSTERSYMTSGFIHFWRSFSWCCRDVWMPVRAINLRSPGGTGSVAGMIYHFGYAQNPATIRYKMDIHGHKDEIRPRWFEDIFLGWPERKTDIHPTTLNWWNAEQFDKTTLPQLLKNHPYYGLETIG